MINPSNRSWGLNGSANIPFFDIWQCIYTIPLKSFEKYQPYIDSTPEKHAEYWLQEHGKVFS